MKTKQYKQLINIIFDAPLPDIFIFTALAGHETLWQTLEQQYC